MFYARDFENALQKIGYLSFGQGAQFDVRWDFEYAVSSGLNEVTNILRCLIELGPAESRNSADLSMSTIRFGSLRNLFVYGCSKVLIGTLRENARIRLIQGEYAGQ